MKAREIADFVGGELSGKGDVEITSVADISRAETGDIAFIENAPSIPETRASCIIVPNGFIEKQEETRTSVSVPLIAVKNSKLAFALVAAVLHPSKHREGEIHESAIIAHDAVIGKDVFIGAFTCVGEGSAIGDGTQIRAGAKIGDGVKVGKDCVIHPNVFIEDGCTIGDRVILHTGVVVGGDGFGYVREENGAYTKFPQIGIVVIENDVEIGANTCIDRGALGETRIGSGTKIDNLVQIAHNVQIGKHCVIAAQTGISGSTVIEDGCVIAGQVGMGEHARILKGAVIGARGMVLPRKIVRPGIWMGVPVQPLDEYKRQNAHIKGLERLKAEVKRLSQIIDNIDTSDGKD